MVLEGIAGEKVKRIKASLQELIDARELYIPDALKSISNIETEYNALVKENGIDYCTKNCPEVPTLIKSVYRELNS